MGTLILGTLRPKGRFHRMGTVTKLEGVSLRRVCRDHPKAAGMTKAAQEDQQQALGQRPHKSAFKDTST